jgi:glycosyltransferase involved in cell wall biosynthesis
MKLLIPSIVDLRKTAPNRLHHFIKYLSKKHEITALCVNDWWKAESVDTNKCYQDFNEILDNIEINYITERRISPFKQEFLSRRLMNLNDKEGYDIIFNYNTLISGHHVAKKMNLPMVYDLADDLPAMIANSPQISPIARPFGKWIGSRALKKNVRLSRMVTGITRGLKDNYSIPDNKFELVPNGVDTELFRKIENGLREELGMENDFVLGYVGVLREWIDLEPVYQAVKSMDNVKLIIVGEEGMSKENKECVKKYGIEDNVIFTGTIPYNKVPEHISAMDACLIPFKQNAISQYALPLKLFEYMSCEKPVISTRIEGVVDNVGERVLYADSMEEYTFQIKNLINNQDLREDLGRNGRTFVIGRYDWENIAERLDDILNEKR